MSIVRALLTILAFLLNAGEAGAHASLVSTAPPDGALLAAAPQEVVLRFDEAVSPLVFRLVDDTGANVPLPATARAEGALVRVPLPPRMRDGTYLFSYRVTSADSHPVGGSIALSIGSASSSVRAEGTTTADAGGLLVAVRAARDGALLIAAGCALFLLLVAPFPGERWVLLVAGNSAAAFSALGVGLQGAALTGIEDLLVLQPWLVAVHTTYGSSAIVGATGSLVIAFGGMAPRGAPRSIFLAIGALSATVSLPLTGHAASSPAAFARLVVSAHALAAAFWAGSLVALYAAITRRSAGTAQTLRHFSKLAMAAVPALVVAGIGFAFIQLDSFSDLAHTRYGNLIIAKSLLLVALIGIAAGNRFVLLPALDRGSAGALPLLRGSIAAELALIAAILALTAVLVQTSPRATSIEKLLVSGSYKAILKISPGRPGMNQIEVTLRDKHDLPFDTVEATLEIANPSAQVETIKRALVYTHRGVYRHSGSEIAFRGFWNLGIRIRVTDFEDLELSGDVEIR